MNFYKPNKGRKHMVLYKNLKKTWKTLYESLLFIFNNLSIF